MRERDGARYICPVPTATPPSDWLLVEQHARDIHSAALAAVDPGPAVRRALSFVVVPPGARVFLVALGKAAPAMASAAVAGLRTQGIDPAGGLLVSHVESHSPHPAIEARVGDHPLPGTRSAAAAERLGELVRHVGPRDVVWVLLSGGTSSLIGAPAAMLTVGELAALHELLLASGMGIAQINIVRKRVSRWGAGRLAQALEPAHVRVLAISDVPDDDLAVIGSGPLAPDPTTVADVTRLLETARLWTRVPAAVRDLLSRQDAIETPKRDDPAFRHVSTEIIASNDTAVRAALDRAAQLGYQASRAATPLDAEASAVGDALAGELLAAAGRGTPVCLVRGGEPVVALEGVGPNGVGGRAQELALAAARRLTGADGASRPMVLLAAGTDGRDGPTDAAGALVSPRTWRAITDARRDPARDLARHDAYRALDAAGALLRTGPTGTNVMDIAIMLVR
jgi:glycerate-2-kinase